VNLELPELVDLNTYINAERRNRFMAAKIKSQQTMLVARLAEQQLKPWERINKITFIWRHKDRRKDPDNMTFASKFVFDGLVVAGIFKTDGWKLWRGNPKINHRHEIDPTNPGVLVIIK